MRLGSERDLDAPVLEGLVLVRAEQVLVDELVVRPVRLAPVDVLSDGLHEAPLGVLDVGEVVDIPCGVDGLARVLCDGQSASALVLLRGGERDEHVQHPVEGDAVDLLGDERVAEVLQGVEVRVAESEHVARVAHLVGQVLRVPALPHVAGFLHAPLQGVLADDADGRGVHADCGVAVVSVAEGDERVDLLVGVAADQDVPVEAGECPDLAAIVEAACGVVVRVTLADDLVEEVEGFDVLNDVVSGSDDSERGAGVHADVGDLVVDEDVLLVHGLAVLVDDGRDVGVDLVLLDSPVQSGEADGLCAGDHVLVDHRSEAVPCGLPSSVERLVVFHDAVAHVVLPSGGVPILCHKFVA